MLPPNQNNKASQRTVLVEGIPEEFVSEDKVWIGRRLGPCYSSNGSQRSTGTPIPDIFRNGDMTRDTRILLDQVVSWNAGCKLMVYVWNGLQIGSERPSSFDPS